MTAFPLKKIVGAFKARFGGQVEYDREVVGGVERFSFYLVSQHFKSLSHLKRQDAVWKVVDETLSREQALRVASVLALVPGEIESLVR